MTDTDTTAGAITMAQAAYEAASLLASYEDRGATAGYVSINIHRDGTAAVAFLMDTASGVHDWARLIGDDPATARLITSPLAVLPPHTGSSGRPHTTTTVTFTSPFDSRVTFQAYSVTYEDEAQS